jgi:hypothetical protein
MLDDYRGNRYAVLVANNFVKQIMIVLGLCGLCFIMVEASR